jgi:hypothetical protein
MGVEVIINVVVVIAVSAVLGYLTSAALRSKSITNVATGERTFSHTRPLKALALLSLALPLFMGFLTYKTIRSGESDPMIFAVMFLIFSAMSLYLLLECFFTRIVISAEAITSASPWGGERTFRWAEINSVSYSEICKWHIVAGPDGKKIRASDYLSGINELVLELKRRVPSENWVRAKRESVLTSGRRV